MGGLECSKGKGKGKDGGKGKGKDGGKGFKLVLVSR